MARTNPYREPCLPEVEAEDGSIDAFATHVAAQRRRAVLSTGVVIACIALAGAVAIGAQRASAQRHLERAYRDALHCFDQDPDDAASAVRRRLRARQLESAALPDGTWPKRCTGPLVELATTAAEAGQPVVASHAGVLVDDLAERSDPADELLALRDAGHAAGFAPVGRTDARDLPDLASPLSFRDVPLADRLTVTTSQSSVRPSEAPLWFASGEYVCVARVDGADVDCNTARPPWPQSKTELLGVEMRNVFHVCGTPNVFALEIARSLTPFHTGPIYGVVYARPGHGVVRSEVPGYGRLVCGPGAEAWVLGPDAEPPFVSRCAPEGCQSWDFRRLVRELTNDAVKDPSSLSTDVGLVGGRFVFAWSSPRTGVRLHLDHPWSELANWPERLPRGRVVFDDRPDGRVDEREAIREVTLVSSPGPFGFLVLGTQTGKSVLRIDADTGDVTPVRVHMP